jgi:hypothetical protein
MNVYTEQLSVYILYIVLTILYPRSMNSAVHEEKKEKYISIDLENHKGRVTWHETI